MRDGKGVADDQPARTAAAVVVCWISIASSYQSLLNQKVMYETALMK